VQDRNVTRKTFEQSINMEWLLPTITPDVGFTPIG